MTEFKPYVIRQGDYLAQLAYIHGFDADEAWLHDSNDELRSRRPNPDVLYPGDILHIPAQAKAPGPILAQASNAFKASVPLVRVELVLQDEQGPLANRRCGVRGIGADDLAAFTGDDGTLSLQVPVTTTSFEVEVEKTSTILNVFVDRLDPVDETLGVVKRLSNLGYLGADADAEATLDEATVADAVYAFRQDQKLGDADALDAGTRTALLELHGI